MSRISDTRDRILDHANNLLLQRGYHGFSYRDISEPLGVRNAAIHYHFRSKADLALAVIQKYQQLLSERTSRFMAEGGSARAQMEGLFGFTRHECVSGHSLCPAGALAADFGDLPQEIQAASQRLTAETRAWLTRVLEVGRAQAEFHFKGDAGQRALMIAAALQGGRQMARSSDSGILDQVIDQIRNDLGMEEIPAEE